jgi:hypothetical protein
MGKIAVMTASPSRLDDAAWTLTTRPHRFRCSGAINLGRNRAVR